MEKEQFTNKEEKKSIIANLLNLQHPEMISFVRADEVDDIAILLSLAVDLQNAMEFVYDMKKNTMEDNFLLMFIKNDLLVRFSIKGKRSEQLVEVTKDIMQDENKKIDLSKVKF
jgi:hypothetical protein